MDNQDSGACKRVSEGAKRQCLRCGTTEDLTRDHVIPKAVLKRILTRDEYEHFSQKTGRPGLNIQVLCAECNQDKGCTTIDYREPTITDRLRSWLEEHYGVILVNFNTVNVDKYLRFKSLIK